VSISPGCYRTPGCRYCATGMVSERDQVTDLKLDADDVKEQVTATLREVRKQHPSFGTRSLSLSFMGKGEPGLYPDVVMQAVDDLYGDGTITTASLATTGLPRYFRELAKAYHARGGGFPAPLLQVSIHAPFDADRAELVTNPRALAPLDDVLTSAVDDYALSVLPPGIFITVRLNLMSWGEGKTNFNDASLDELARLVRTHTERARPEGFGGIVVIVAALNPTNVIGEQGIRAVGEDDLYRTIAQLDARGVPVREFSGGTVKTKVGGCGTLSCDLRSAPLEG
jgi:hypothetical protein